MKLTVNIRKKWDVVIKHWTGGTVCIDIFDVFDQIINHIWFVVYVWEDAHYKNINFIEILVINYIIISTAIAKKGQIL